MKSLIKPLLRVLMVLIAISSVLLFSDQNSRKSNRKDTERMTLSTNTDSLQTYHPDQKLKINLIQFNDSPLSELSEKGIIDGFSAYGMVRDQEYELQIANAQGDIAALNMMIDAAQNDRPDLIFVTSTPTLQVAAKKIKEIPVVFSVVADPIIAGAGTSFTEHLPNVTGISTLGDYEGMITLLKTIIPDVKKIGTLYSPGESNSEKNMHDLKQYAEAGGLQLVTSPINSSTEVTDAIMSLVSQHPDAICQVVDNLTSSSFTGIQKVAQSSKTPLFAFVSEQAEQGAMLVLSRDYHQAGVDAVRLAVRIFKGEKPADIPFEFVSKTDLLINPESASYYGLKIPESIYQRENLIIIK
jgi:ABC-type uncharacterized transport system substrate-binding protein